MNPEELARILGMQSEGSEPSYPLRDAQIEEFKIVLREAVDKQELQYGDIVEYKHRRGPLNEGARRGLLMVFWGAIDTAYAQNLLPGTNRAEIQTSAVLDCVVAHLEPDGPVVFTPTDSSGLRRVGQIDWRAS